MFHVKQSDPRYWINFRETFFIIQNLKRETFKIIKFETDI